MPAETKPPKSFLLFTLEFLKGTIFSGNGVLATTYATELARLGHRVDIVCSRPVDHCASPSSPYSATSSAGPEHHILENSKAGETEIAVISVPVPGIKWRKLDRAGPFQEMAEECAKLVCAAAADAAGATSSSACDVAGGSATLFNMFGDLRRRRRPHETKVSAHRENLNDDVDYQFVLVIDWHGFVPAEACDAFNKNKKVKMATSTSVVAPSSSSPSSPSRNIFPKNIWLNFRIFNNRFLGDTRSDEYRVYKRLEVQAARKADLTVVLSKTDTALLVEMLNEEAKQNNVRTRVSLPRIAELAPPLQPAFLDLVTKQQQHEHPQEQQQPCMTFYLACCVRLDPTKGAHKFVDLVEALARRNNQSNGSDQASSSLSSSSAFSLVRSERFQAARVIPFLCGAAPANSEYAETVRSRLRRCCPPGSCVVREDFVSPSELAAYWSASILNIHSAVYDAYGMSVAEAAALGCMSATHGEKLPSSSLSSSSPSCVSCSCYEVDDEQRKLWLSPVGATDLLEVARNEVVLTNFERSGGEIASALEPLLVRLLERRCSESQQLKGENKKDVQLDAWITGMTNKVLSWDATAAVQKLICLCESV